MMKMAYDAPSGMLWLSIMIDDLGEQIRTGNHLHGSVFDASRIVLGVHHNTWKFRWMALNFTIEFIQCGIRRILLHVHLQAELI
ncbi:hypothetical protein Tco_0478482 [Tanacetum coccineum]